MLYLGKQVTSARDPLQPVAIQKVYKALINPNGKVAEQLNRLQHIRLIDPNKYRKLKTELPYLVCAQFHPMIRRKENFLHTERFLIDIDHLSEYEIDQGQLRLKLMADKRVELLFSSPSGDGLKALFRLNQKISDSSYYALFYKSFCVELNKRYQLGAALDSTTNDVTRCCFVSYDPKTYYNENPELIDPENYLIEEGFIDFDQVHKELKAVEKINQAERKMAEIQNQPKVLTDGVLNQIKERIGKRVRTPKPKQFYQPEELENLVKEIQLLLEETGAELVRTTPINYGRVLRIKADQYWAEINLFYGQKGTTVVRTLKTGSNKDLANMMYELLNNYFEGR